MADEPLSASRHSLAAILMTAKQRSWWNFRLWQLFAVITLLCVYLAWQVSIVRGRKELLKELAAVSLHSHVTTADQHSRDPYIPPGSRAAPARVTFVRRWLGDEAIQSIGYDVIEVHAPLVSRLIRQFPEAEVHAVARIEPPYMHPPCHPGCFPHGTFVETPSGPRKIETIAIGDEVFQVTDTGERIPVRVQSIFRTENRLWEVETSRGRLLTTETQPLCKTLYESVAAGELTPGDEILAWENNQVQTVAIIRVQRTEQVVPVVNLVLGNREAMIAGGYLARSKPQEETRIEVGRE